MSLRAILGAMALFSLAGCAEVNVYETSANHPFIATTQRAAEGLIQQIGKSVEPNAPLIVATLVDVNDLEKSSALGRTLSEQLSVNIARSSFRVIELKYRNSVYVKRSQGELVLTRELKELAQTHNAGAVIAGTYTVGSEFVFVNLKAIRPEDNVIIAGQNIALPLDHNTRTLLRQ